MLSSLKGKVKDVSTKIFSIYRPKTQRRLDRELNQARSKPYTVDRPVRTACIFVHHYNSTNTALSPDQHHKLRCGQVEVGGGAAVLRGRPVEFHLDPRALDST